MGIVRTVEPPVTGIPSATQTGLWIAIAHGVNDAYAAFLAPLLPRVMDRLGLSITLAATLAMTLSLAASLPQPFFGYLADRFGRKLFIVAGPMLSGIFLSSIGLAPTFVVLVIFLLLGGLGSAAFHPPGASAATRVVEGGGSGLRVSLFSFGGTIGYSAGPLIAVGLVALVGLKGMPIAMIVGILLAMVLWRVMPSGPEVVQPVRPPSPGRVLRLLRGPLGLLFGISAVVAFGQRVFLTMEPIIVAGEGGSEAWGAMMLTIYLFSQAGGTLMGGILTDRIDRGRLLAGLTLLAAPAHLMAVWLPSQSVGAVIFAAAAGFLGMAILPPVIVMAQELMPEGAAVGAGIAMGLAWAAGSIGVLGTGVLGDLLGPRNAAVVSMPVILVGTMLAVHPTLREVSNPFKAPDRYEIDPS